MSNCIAGVLDTKLPVRYVFHQKLAFDDTKAAIPCTLPFTIDLDPQTLKWTDDGQEVLSEDPSLHWILQEMPEAVHCRPDGDHGDWVILGWAFNNETTLSPCFDHKPFLNNAFPEIVLSGASRLNPSLERCCEDLPRKLHHYGGWYSMAEENWPTEGTLGSEYVLHRDLEQCPHA
jgi:hypothetical protein